VGEGSRRLQTKKEKTGYNVDGVIVHRPGRWLTFCKRSGKEHKGDREDGGERPLGMGLSRCPHHGEGGCQGGGGSNEESDKAWIDNI